MNIYSCECHQTSQQLSNKQPFVLNKKPKQILFYVQQTVYLKRTILKL